MNMRGLRDIKARAEAATEGPWAVDAEGWIESPSAGTWVVGADPGASISDAPHVAMPKVDKKFILHAREDVPKLVAALEAVGRIVFALEVRGATGDREIAEELNRAIAEELQ